MSCKIEPYSVLGVLSAASKAPSQASLRSTRGRGGKTTPLGRGAGKGRGRRGGAMPR